MLISSLVLLASLQATGKQDKPFPLMVGDPAPPIEVTEWVQGQPLKGFQKGQVYVVEFWATWCGPCKIAIPHLNELHQHYGDKVNFVGVSVWEHLERDPYSVPEFVKDMGDKMTYTVASDRVKEGDSARMARSWMENAGQHGIPTAFIVNREGRVAWIGHPFGIDKPLAAVVDDTWDLAAAIQKHADGIRLAAVTERLQKEIAQAKKAENWTGAVSVIETAVQENPALESSFGIQKYLLLVKAGKSADAASYGQRLVADVLAKEANALNSLAWVLVDPAGKITNPDLGLAVRAAQRAVELTESKDAGILDTLGLALFLSGDVEHAIATQEKAVELSKGSPDEADLKKRLDEFRAKKGA